MKNKYLRLLIGIIIIMVAFVRCKKDSVATHNASSPITVDSFIPQAGGGGTEVLISGSNFTTDTSQVSVTINGKKLKVIATNTKQLIAIVPKKAGTGPIEVTIGSGSVTTSGIFTYQYTRTVTTLAGTGVAGFANGDGADAMFDFNGQNWYRSCGIVTDDALNVYVADPGNHCIRKIDTAGNVTTFAGNPYSAGYADGKGTAAVFNLPYGLAIDNEGNVYCVDPVNYDIRKISPDGTAVTIGWGNQSPWDVAVDNKTGYVYYDSNSAPGNVYQITEPFVTNQVISGLNYPAGMVMDTDGNIYIAGNGDQTITKFTAGTWAGTVIAGQLGALGYVDGPGASAKFANPWGMGIDAGNNLYVAGNGTYDGNVNSPDQSIRYIDAKTFVVSTFAGSGTAGYVDGVGKAAAFSAPGGVAVDKNGTVYVLDKNNNRIRKIVSE